MLRAISLFSGAGGDTLGLDRAGIHVVAFNEINDAARQTHLAAFPASVPIEPHDIKRVPDAVLSTYAGTIDLIFAGFPCQGFSHAGKKRSNDARNELVWEFERATRLIRPKWILGENVKGLLSRRGRDPTYTGTGEPPLIPVIDILRGMFERIGYRITYRVLDAATLGVPQNRKRLLIVGHRGTEYPHMPWDDLVPASPSTPFATSLRGILEPHLVGAVELPRVPYAPETRDPLFWIPTEATSATGTPHPNLVRLVEGIRNPSSKEKEKAATSATIKEPAGLVSFGVRKSGYHGMVVHPDVPCNTIISTYNLCPRLFVGLYTASTGTYWVRCMTPRELAQIQGFPATYPWCGSDKEAIIQIGNAVPPPLAERVARSLSRVVFRSEPQSTDGGDGVEGDDEDD